MSSSLITHIQRYIKINDAETQIISEHLRSFDVKKKDFLHKEGQICKSNYFVAKGCLRMFFVDEKGTEQTTQFALENWWLADYMSFTNQSVSPFNIQAVENSEIIAVDHSTEDELFKKVPLLERYFRIIAQRAYAASQLRIKYLYDFSREEGYRHFISRFPEFAQRIPQYMLASYLGFTPEYLSEIRKKKY